MDSKDCRAEVGRSQNRRSARILQVRQLAMMSSPYGESISSPQGDISRYWPRWEHQGLFSGHALQRLTGMASDQTPVTRVTVTVSARRLPTAVIPATTCCDDAHRDMR